MTPASKTVKILFWVSTSLIVLSSLPSIFMVNAPGTIEAFNHLGVGASWFRWELEIAKTLAAIILILPMIRWRIKEWAYVGLGIDFISALIALWTIDGFGKAWFVIIFIIILATSYITYHKIQGTKTPLI